MALESQDTVNTYDHLRKGPPHPLSFQGGVRRPQGPNWLFLNPRTPVILTGMDVQRTKHVTYKVGDLVSSLGGPLAPAEAEHYRKEQAQQEYLWSSVPA